MKLNSKTAALPCLDENSERRKRASEKLHTLEINIGALLASEMDQNHKRLVLSVLYDYKTTLLNRLNPRVTELHQQPNLKLEKPCY